MSIENERIDAVHWLAVNDQGDRALSFESPEDAVSLLIDEHGDAAFRTVKLNVTMALPTAVEADHVEITAQDGDESEVDIEEENEGAELPAAEDDDEAPTAVHVPAEQSAPAAVTA
jgi:hypothetical protein